MKIRYTYFVTTIRVIDEEDPREQYVDNRQRTPAFFSNLKDAKICLKENWGDIHECDFNYAVIEKTTYGVYPFSKKEYWYKWSNTKQMFIPTKKPNCFRNICSFSVG